jgi:hypothetical protein
LSAGLIAALLGVDAAGCLLACLVFDRTGPGLLGAALARREDDVRPGNLADLEPESLGLDVSFWSLFRWRLSRDPLVRAERRAFWTWPRLVALWLGLAAAEAGLRVLLQTNILWTYMWAYMQHPAIIEYLVVVLTFVFMLPYWFIPVMVAGSLASQRRSGVLESMAATPAAPLRLAAAQLVGKLGHFFLAMTVLNFAREFLWLLLSETGRYSSHNSFLWTPLGGLVTAQIPLVFIAVCGTVALCFAARFRSLFAALALSYGILLPMFIGCNVVYDWLHRAAGLYENSWNARLASILSIVLLLLAYGAVLRVFLMAAARRLALPPDDRA